jgi:molybdate transport system regulatory protein
MRGTHPEHNRRTMGRRLHLEGALGHAATDKRLEILRLVGEGGSISQAARAAGVSYKAAWQALDMLSNLAGVPLVERVVGGAGGGGARLTAAGTRLLRAGSEMARSRERVLAALQPRRGGASLDALGFKSSMRNQLPATVAGLEAQQALVRVTLALAGGHTIASRITRESAELLALAPGAAVLALCKATGVEVFRAPPTATAAAPRPNVLTGRTVRTSRGDAGDEIVLELAGGLRIVGFAAPRSGLRIGSRVCAHLAEAGVVIAAVA